MIKGDLKTKYDRLPKKEGRNEKELGIVFMIMVALLVIALLQ